MLDRSPPGREADANADGRRPENGVARRTGEETAMEARSARPMSTTDGHADTEDPAADRPADVPAGPTDDDAPPAPPAPPSGLAAARLHLAEIGSRVAPPGQPPRLLLLGILGVWVVTVSGVVVW